MTSAWPVHRAIDRVDVYLNGHLVQNPSFVSVSLPAEPVPELGGALAWRGRVTVGAPLGHGELIEAHASIDGPQTLVYAGWVQVVAKPEGA